MENKNYLLCLRKDAVKPEMLAAATEMGLTLCDDVLVEHYRARQPFNDRIHRMSNMIKMNMEDEFFKKWRPR